MPAARQMLNWLRETHHAYCSETGIQWPWDLSVRLVRSWAHTHSVSRLSLSASRSNPCPLRSPPTTHYLRKCLQDLLHPVPKIKSLGGTSQSFYLSSTQDVTPNKVINNTFSLGNSPKRSTILTTVNAISMTAPETGKNQLPSKVGSLTKGQSLYWKPQVGTGKWLLRPDAAHTREASDGLLSTNLLGFDKTILSVIWLFLSVYLTALWGTLFLFQVQSSYTDFFFVCVFSPSINQFGATVETKWRSNVHSRYQESIILLSENWEPNNGQDDSLQKELSRSSYNHQISHFYTQFPLRRWHYNRIISRTNSMFVNYIG